MQEIVEVGGSKELMPCDECGGIVRCYHTSDTLGNTSWLCFGCLTWIYGYKRNK
ncbi:hypothetical protein M0R04_11325 [Candidatus Dojkabacteria bacterium]|jgi:hypothetical protein|nr:hypothetical protein [Candidatus Dojkabacteria bacterium]